MSCQLLACSVLGALFAPQGPSDLSRIAITGIVIDAARRPVPNCEVWVDDPAMVQHTDGSGQFALKTARRLFVGVHARAPGQGCGAIWVDGRERARATVLVPLWPTRTLRGSVRDLDGKPLAGAHIAAGPTDMPDLALAQASTQSDADGNYVLEDVVLGPVVVRATKPGFGATLAYQDCNAADAREDIVDLVIDPDECRRLEVAVTGLTPAQREQAVVRVFAEHENMTIELPRELATAHLDAAGNCAFVGMPQRASLHVEVECGGAVLSPPNDFAPSMTRACRLAFRVEAPTRLRGRVVAGGAPVAGAMLAIFAASQWPVQRPTLAVTAADGTFAVPSPVAAGGRVEVALLDSEYLPAEAAGSAPGRIDFVHDPTVQQSIELERADVFTGRIVDEHEQALAAAQVLWAREDSGTTFADLDGRFRFVQPHTGAEVMTLLVGEVAGAAKWQRPVDDSGHTDLGALVVVRGGAIRGRIAARNGEPVPGARVMLGGLADIDLQRIAIADRNGRYAFLGLPEGSYRVGPYGRVPDSDQLDLGPGLEAVCDLTIK